MYINEEIILIKNPRYFSVQEGKYFYYKDKEKPSWCWGVFGWINNCLLLDKIFDTKKYMNKIYSVISKYQHQEFSNLSYIDYSFCHGYTGFLYYIKYIDDLYKSEESSQLVNELKERIEKHLCKLYTRRSFLTEEELFSRFYGVLSIILGYESLEKKSLFSNLMSLRI